MDILSIEKDLCSATKAAAIEARKYLGKKDGFSADKVAVNAMRRVLSSADFTSRIVIGEGERDKAPMLFIGEKLGNGNNKFDIAVDPLEGTNMCANNLPGAFSVIAAAKVGEIIFAPDIYMEKIAFSSDLPKDVVSLKNNFYQNILNICEAKSIPAKELRVTILNRPRHKEMIDKLTGIVDLKLIEDGDIAATIDVATRASDCYLGIGGAPEGVISSVVTKSLGAHFYGRFHFINDSEKIRATNMGIGNLDKIYYQDDLVTGDAIFVASPVTKSDFISLDETLVIDTIRRKMIKVSFNNE